MKVRGVEHAIRGGKTSDTCLAGKAGKNHFCAGKYEKPREGNKKPMNRSHQLKPEASHAVA